MIKPGDLPDDDTYRQEKLRAAKSGRRSRPRPPQATMNNNRWGVFGLVAIGIVVIAMMASDNNSPKTRLAVKRQFQTCSEEAKRLSDWSKQFYSDCMRAAGYSPRKPFTDEDGTHYPCNEEPGYPECWTKTWPF
jgi:hypothetical protein